MSREIPSTITSIVAAEQNQPVELYSVFLDTGTLYFAQAEDYVVFGVQTYTPLAITRSPVRTSAELEADELSVSLDNVDRTFSQRVIDTDFIGRRLWIQKVFRGYLDTASKYVTIFDGRMDAPALDQQRFTVKVRSWLDALHHQVPRRLYSTFCNYQLYDAFCTVSKTLLGAVGTNTNIVTATALASSTTDVLVTGVLSNYTNDYWNIGTLRVFTGSNRNLGREVYASSQSSMSATARIPFPYTINSGDVVSLTRGCRKTLADCNSKFSNFTNFGGYPTVPETPLL